MSRGDRNLASPGSVRTFLKGHLNRDLKHECGQQVKMWEKNPKSLFRKDSADLRQTGRCWPTLRHRDNSVATVWLCCGTVVFSEIRAMGQGQIVSGSYRMC